MISTAAPVPATPLDADRRRLAERHVDAELLGERRLDDLLLDLAVERERPPRRGVVVAQRRSAGPARRAGSSATCSAPRSAGLRGDDDGLERRRRELPARVAGRPRADRVADPHVGQARRACRSGPRATARARRPPSPPSNTPIAVTFASRPSPTRPGRARDGARAHADVARPSRPPAPRSTLNTVPGDRAVRRRRRRRAGAPSRRPMSASTPAPVIAEPKNTGCTTRARASAPPARGAAARCETLASPST